MAGILSMKHEHRQMMVKMKEGEQVLIKWWQIEGRRPDQPVTFGMNHKLYKLIPKTEGLEVVRIK
jgi:hypothetical protein